MMTFGERLKELRKARGMNQQTLANELSVAKATISAWEVGTREPDFEKLASLSAFFDRRIDYILGQSEDASTCMPTDEDTEQLGIWQAEEDFYDAIMKYLRLDSYGKDAVESVIRAEYARCREQDQLSPSSDFQLSVRIRTEKPQKAE